MSHLSISEASALTGKNEKTIRRLIKKPESQSYVRLQDGKLFIDADYIKSVYNLEQSIPNTLSTQTGQTPGQIEGMSTQDTGHVYPTLGTQPGQVSRQTEEVSTQIETTPKVLEPLLPKEYYLNLIAAKDATIQVINDQLQSKDQQLQVKDQQLQAKDQQMQTKDEQLSQLIERTREQNIIIQSLQEKVTRQIGPPQGTEAAAGSKQRKAEAKTPFVDKVLLGVAAVVSIALLLFFALMLIAYLNR